jgi:putative peptidoglycan lipid II flippase
VVAAAAGVAVGSVLMVATQLPSFVRHIGFPRRLISGSAMRRGGILTLGAFGPIAVYTLARQAQVFVERFLGSDLPPGTISHLNYAQKVAQMPMLVALLVATVTFPTLARNMAVGQVREARLRLQSDLGTVTALIAVAAAYLITFAPTVVRVLLQHGEFTPADTSATAAIMRVYAAGLLGQALVGVLCRPFFTGGRPGWYPAMAMGAGLAVTIAVAIAATPAFGGPAIAAANAVGISFTALLLLLGLRRRTVAVPLAGFASVTARLVLAAGGAGAAGWLAGRALAGQPSIVVAAAGGVVVLAAFVALAHLLRAREVTSLTTKILGRNRHAR